MYNQDAIDQLQAPTETIEAAQGSAMRTAYFMLAWISCQLKVGGTLTQ